MSSIICFWINDRSLRCAVTKCGLNAFIFHSLFLLRDLKLNNGPVFLGSQTVGWEPEEYISKWNFYHTQAYTRTRNTRMHIYPKHTFSWLFSLGLWKGAWNMARAKVPRATLHLEIMKVPADLSKCQMLRTGCCKRWQQLDLALKTRWVRTS